MRCWRSEIAGELVMPTAWLGKLGLLIGHCRAGFCPKTIEIAETGAVYGPMRTVL